MTDATTLLAASGIVGLFSIVTVLLITLVRLMLRENVRSKRESDQCTRRLNIVINCLNENGIKVPPEVWETHVA